MNVLSNKNKIQISLVSYKEGGVEIYISNNDFGFTEKIISDKIAMENLRYKIRLEKVDNMESVIKSKYIPKFSKSEDGQIEYIPHSFGDLPYIMNNLQSEYLYRCNISLVEIFPMYLPEIERNFSNAILFNTRHGVIDEDKITKLNKYRYGGKKINSQSEKEVMKQINSEIEFRELGEILNKSEVKKMTFHNRDYRGINTFVNSNDKFSKKMTEERKKKVLYTVNAKLFFEEKMEKNKNTGAEFLQNEWFMGPLYSYDPNYKKLI